MTRPPGRPPAGARATRADILSAARTLFADLGFDRTTMRAVASHAGVDVALIYHHFGSKDGLLGAVLTLPEGARLYLQPIPADASEPGRAVAAAVFGLWEDNLELREQAIAMIRTALSNEHAAQLLQHAHTATVLALVGKVVVDDDRELRASLIGAYLSGLLLTRHVFKVPELAAADRETLVDAAGPVIERYLRGYLST